MNYESVWGKSKKRMKGNGKDAKRSCQSNQRADVYPL